MSWGFMGFVGSCACSSAVNSEMKELALSWLLGALELLPEVPLAPDALVLAGEPNYGVVIELIFSPQTLTLSRPESSNGLVLSKVAAGALVYEVSRPDC